MLKNFRFTVILLSLSIVLLSGCADNGINNLENSVESDFRENTANDNLNNEINLSSDSINYSEKAISESPIDDDFNPIKTENNITYGSETLRGFILNKHAGGGVFADDSDIIGRLLVSIKKSDTVPILRERGGTVFY